jgi:tRNA pseudouridine55 synthase
VKVGGRPAYKIAARGGRVDLKAKQVMIYGIEVVRYDYPVLELVVRCGRGTYIRSLARDIGDALATGACCQTLTRLAVGPFHIDQSIRLADADHEHIRKAILTVQQVRQMLGPDRGDRLS